MSKEEDVKDPQALLKAYREAVEDLKTVREENKTLKEAGSDEVISKWRERAIRAEAKVAVQSTGVKDSERVLKYLNLEGVDFDEKDELRGLDDKIDELKKDFPELFDPKKRAGKTGVDIHEGKPAHADKSLTEQQVDSLFA